MNNPQTAEQPFGLVLKQLMDNAGMNNSTLARLTGLSETTIRRMLKVGVVEDTLRLDPIALAAVCEILPLDFDSCIRNVYDIQLPPKEYSVEALVLADLYDQLPEEKRTLLESLILTLIRDSDLPIAKHQVKKLIKRVEELKQKHPLFSEVRRRPVARAAWVFIDVFPKSNHQAMVDMLLFALDHLFSLPEEKYLVPQTEAELMSIIHDRHNMIVLNAIIADTRLNTPIKRLYWTFFILTDNRTRFVDMPLVYHQALAELWRLMMQIYRGEDLLKTS